MRHTVIALIVLALGAAVCADTDRRRGRRFDAEVDANTVTVSGAVVISEPWEPCPGCSWRLLLHQFPHPTVSALVSALCPAEPGNPLLTDTYRQCADLEPGQHVELRGVILGHTGADGGTTFFVTEVIE